jgi:nucleotide-binding universal stress UspA family protein
MLVPGSAEIRLLRVVERQPSDVQGPVSEAPDPALDDPRRVFEDAGHAVQTHHRVGGGPTEILDEINEWTPDLVVLGRWRARAFERWAHGSVFDRVIRHVHVPVLMVTHDPERADEAPSTDLSGRGKAQAEVEPFRVLVPTRGSSWALRACRLAVRMLPPGSVEVRLLTVLPSELYPLPYTVEGREMFDMTERLRWVEEAADPAVAEPRRVFEQAGHAVSVHHRFGPPPGQILSEIDDWKPDLVVMGRWRGVSALEWVTGSIFERVMRQANAPVLIVK